MVRFVTRAARLRIPWRRWERLDRSARAVPTAEELSRGRRRLLIALLAIGLLILALWILGGVLTGDWSFPAGPE